MIKFVLLDIDDTLLDFGKAEAAAIRKTFDHIGIPVSDELIRRYSEINDLQWKRLEKGELTRDEVLVHRFDILFDELKIKNVPSEMVQATYEYLLGVGHYFVDGAEELLKALYGKYELYIVSNGTANVQERRIKSADIGKYFNGIFVSEHIGFEKPRKEFFDSCFAQIPGFDKDSAIIVGDRLSSDILGGINAGVKTCWFNRKNDAPDPEIPADYEIHSLAELPALLERI